jgi:hypothetical protein
VVSHGKREHLVGRLDPGRVGTYLTPSQGPPGWPPTPSELILMLAMKPAVPGQQAPGASELVT